MLPARLILSYTMTLDHLRLWRADKPSRAPTEIIRQDETETQLFDDGWAGYDEPGITLH